MSYFSKLKVAELEELLTEAGVEIPADAKKADLVALAEANLKAPEGEGTSLNAPVGCNHKDQREAIGSGYLECSNCGKEINADGDVINEVGQNVEPTDCDPSHREQREAIGSGYLTCSVCGREIPNEL